MEEAREWLEWVDRATRLVDDRHFTSSAVELIYELERFRDEHRPPKEAEKNRMAQVYEYMYTAIGNTEHFKIPAGLSTPALSRAWNELLNSIERRFALLHEKLASEVCYMSY